MWEEGRWKFHCMYKWGGIYSQGWNSQLWLFNFPHDHLTSMNFKITWLFILQVGQVAMLLGDVCPHGVSQLNLRMARCAESSMVVGFTWCCIRTSLLACTLACLTCSSICKKCMFIHLFVREHIFSRLFVCPSMNTSSHGHPFLNTSLYMNHFFVCSQTCPFACTLLVHPICRHTMFIHVLLSTVAHDEMKSNL